MINDQLSSDTAMWVDYGTWRSGLDSLDLFFRCNRKIWSTLETSVHQMSRALSERDKQTAEGLVLIVVMQFVVVCVYNMLWQEASGM